MAHSAEGRAAIENLRVVSEELRSCKAKLEEETKLRVSAQQQLAANSADRDDVMQAARDMVSTARQHFDKQQAADQAHLQELQTERLRLEQQHAVDEAQHAVDEARLLELQLELKKYKDRLRLFEHGVTANAGLAAS